MGLAFAGEWPCSLSCHSHSLPARVSACAGHAPRLLGSAGAATAKAASARAPRPQHPAAAAALVVLGGAVAGAGRLAGGARRRRRHWRRLQTAKLRTRRTAAAVGGDDAGGAGAPGPGAGLAEGGNGDPLARFGEWCTLVVNLARRDDRLRKLREILAAASPRLLERLERIDAIDGRQLTFDDEIVQQVVEQSTLDRAKRAKELGIYTVVHDEDNLLVNFDDHMTEGAIACALSHHKALQHLATHPTAEWALILEDDVSIVVPFADQAIARVLEQLPEDWDAVYIGYHHDDGKPHPAAIAATGAVAPPGTVWVPDHEAAADKEGVVVPVEPVYGHCWGLFSWIVRKEVAQQLVEDLFPIRTQVDGAISSWLVRNGHQVFKVPPERLLFYSSCSEEAQDSDIQTMASEDAIIEEYGSMHRYRAHQQQDAVRSDLDELMEDLYSEALDGMDPFNDEHDSLYLGEERNSEGGAWGQPLDFGDDGLGQDFEEDLPSGKGAL